MTASLMLRITEIISFAVYEKLIISFVNVNPIFFLPNEYFLGEYWLWMVSY